VRKFELAILIVVIAVMTGALQHSDKFGSNTNRPINAESQAILDKKCAQNHKLCQAVDKFYLGIAKGKLKTQNDFEQVADNIFQLMTKDKDIQATSSGRANCQMGETALQQSSEHLYDSFYALQATYSATAEKRGKLLTKAHQELQEGWLLSAQGTADIESH
jgi:hypothetical protein